MKQVLVVDDDTVLCQTFSLMFEEIADCTCSSVHSLAELQELGREFLNFNLIILDVDLGTGQPTGVDVYLWLSHSGFQGKMVFLTGHARSDPQVKNASTISNIEIIEKPTSIENLERLITEAK